MLWADRLDLTETGRWSVGAAPDLRPGDRTSVVTGRGRRPNVAVSRSVLGRRRSLEGGNSLCLRPTTSGRAGSGISWLVVVRGATAKSADVSRNGTLVTHDAGLEQQPSPQSQSALVVQRVFPPVAH